MIERGHIDGLSTGLVGRTLAALDATLVIDVRWRGGALDRLLDEDHAALVGHLVQLLHRVGWIVEVEVTYSDFGDRGSFDILAFHPSSRIVLAIEVKTELPSIESTLRKLDEKARLAAKIARDRFGWQVSGVSRLLVVLETSTARRRAARHAAVLDAHLPQRAIAVRHWLHEPAGTLRGLWFLSVRHPRTAIKRTGGRDRVRVARTPSPRPPQTG